MAEAGEALLWLTGGGGGPIPVSWRWHPVGEQRLEHVGDVETLLEWLEEDGTYREWLSAVAAHGRRRVTGSMQEELRAALKWTPRFMGLRRSL
jgi:hypothetical protein